MRANSEIVKIFTGKALNVNALNSINEGFPIGEAIRRLILRLNLVLTNTTGTTAIAEGELNFLKALSFRTSRGWVLYNNVPGRALYRLDQLKLGTLPVKDAISATAGTFRSLFNIWFSDPSMMIPDDTILDTSMFNRLQLDLNLGTVADLLAVVGDSAVTVTADLFAERYRGKLPDKVKPKEYLEVGVPAPVNPASQTELNLERSENLAYKRILVQAANSVTAGTPFSGTPADTTIDAMGIDSDKGELFNKIPWRVLNNLHKEDYGIETAVAGYGVFDFVRSKSKMSAVLGGLFSRLRVIWDNGTLSTSQVSAVYEGLKRIM